MSVVADVEVRDGAQDVRVDRGPTCRRPPRAAGRSPRRSSGRGGPYVELHEVRLHLLEVDRQPGGDEPLAEPPRAPVVVGEPVEVVVERVDAGGGHDAGLAHGAAEQELGSGAPSSSAPRTRHERAERAAEPLGQAEGDRVEVATELRRRHARGDRGVHEPGAVEVDVEPDSRAGGRDGVRSPRAARPVRRTRCGCSRARPPASLEKCKVSRRSGRRRGSGRSRACLRSPGSPRMTRPEWTVRAAVTRTPGCARSPRRGAHGRAR